jgi:site-specific DNA recombinase
VAVAAGIYCRISKDRAGDELGVDRQREDCERLAAKNGWTVAEVFVDDDLSAYSGKARPSYDRLLEAIKAGTVGAVVAWHPDRLHRSPRELEGFIDLVTASGAAVATVQAGELDLSTASGRMTARVVGAVARHESEQKSERLRRQREQMALQGRANGGRRPFGYERGGHELNPVEAELIREAAGRVLAGESVYAIARDWNLRGITTAGGKTWTTPALRWVLSGPRLAGLRVHHGEIVGPAAWEPIIDRATHERLAATIAYGARRRGRPATSLLSGLLVCGLCGHPLTHSTRSDARYYACNSGPGRAACGRIGIKAEPIEQAIVEAVMVRLDSPALDKEVTRPAPVVADDESAIEADLRAYAEDAGAGRITRAEWMTARKGLEQRLVTARARRAAETNTIRLARYAEQGSLRAAWPNLDTDRRRAVLQAVLHRVEVSAGKGGDPVSRLEPEWSV